MNSQSWSIIIFCYNEEGNIGSVIENSLKALQQLTSGAREIVIVDDGSTDNSYQIIQDYVYQYEGLMHVIHHDVNKGIGYALRSGYENVINENICAIPADGQFNVHELIHHKVIDDGSFISFYRLENTRYSLFRNILSMFNRFINKYFNGLYLFDVNWVKIYKNKELKKLKLILTSSLVESEICAKLILNGNRCIQVSSAYLERKHGKSKGASFKIVRQALLDTIKLTYIMFKYRNSRYGIIKY